MDAERAERLEGAGGHVGRAGNGFSGGMAAAAARTTRAVSKLVVLTGRLRFLSRPSYVITRHCRGAEKNREGKRATCPHARVTGAKKRWRRIAPRPRADALMQHPPGGGDGAPAITLAEW